MSAPFCTLFVHSLSCCVPQLSGQRVGVAQGLEIRRVWVALEASGLVALELDGLALALSFPKMVFGLQKPQHIPGAKICIASYVDQGIPQCLFGTSLIIATKNFSDSRGGGSFSGFPSSFLYYISSVILSAECDSEVHYPPLFDHVFSMRVVFSVYF